MSAIEVLTREGVTVKQLQSTISGNLKDFEEIGIDINARREISAFNSGVSMQLLHTGPQYFSHLLFCVITTFSVCSLLQYALLQPLGSTETAYCKK